ncbi:D-2-hydroxyacid dehydrogenase [Sphingobacterium corticibacterium]|uniref:D-2-hydroxyacid dehydrogenase n=1 Tax=Sphingobacterium corticibacterium TaxID=2484746 RepID=A0A4Q6XUC5_9SPHI|nr:D-2-hydroxyacid dehydrogenase [Sphingobacterium corticibacterium]RZF59956.1 D-2-hydroxyacid dehydrogenase [Sphingobacterium corticibacterium]
MKIVVLDGYAMNPGDLTWNGLQALGDVMIYERSSEKEIIERTKGAEIVLTNKVSLPAHIIEALPALKYIGVMATGYNMIDMDCANKQGIVVTNVPGYSTPSVVQLTFSLLLELCYHTQRHSDAVMKGKWTASPDFCFWDYPLTELSGKTLGIIGFGSIGQKVADVGAAFGMSILAYSRTKTDQSHRKNFRWAAEQEELLAQADIVSLHCPLTPQTENLINAESLSIMKPSAVIINTSRGGLIDAQALADALNEGRISGAGIDVLPVEPPPIDNPLFNAKNCLVTPHIAWATKESRLRLMDVVIGNIKSFLNGQSVNVIS